MKAYQLMTREVISVRADTRLDEVARLLQAHRIRSVPVINDDRQVIGLVRGLDIVIHSGDAAAAGMTAADVMKRGVTCVREEEEISDVAWLVARRGLGMLPVLREGRLVGVISRSDLVRLYAAAG
ncbi:MAG: hypothetical protein BroJett038_04870 [Chloroflexota bacterium]|nr:MAG: hypothetical protein BroJett038_04870 [Chloroflexota bacterium]